MSVKRRAGMAVISSFMAFTLVCAPACAYAQETEADVMQAVEESIASVKETVDEAAQKNKKKSYEGSVIVGAEDAMRAAISMAAGNTDDMSWIENASVSLQEAANETGGPDIELKVYFNDTDLYSLILSYDAASEVLYAVCPQLQDRAMAIPVKKASDEVQSAAREAVSVETVENGTRLMQEAKDLSQEISIDDVTDDLSQYAQIIASHMTAEQGLTTVTAGTLTEESTTVTYSVPSDQMPQLITGILSRISEDDVLKTFMTSDLFNDVVTVTSASSSGEIKTAGGELYQQMQDALEEFSTSDYSELFGFSLKLGSNAGGNIDSVSLSVEAGGVSVDVFDLNMVVSGDDHALEIKLGPVIAGALGLDSSYPAGVLVQGSLNGDILNETVSLSYNGSSAPVFIIKDLDTSYLEQGTPVGSFTAIVSGSEYELEFGENDIGNNEVMLYVNNDLWCVAELAWNEVESTSIDSIDTSDAITVSTQDELAEYFRDASITEALEKLSDAGVPDEYVDMLTSGEASTESSHENTVDRSSSEE